MAEDTVGYLYGPIYRIPFVVTSSMPNGANIARNILEWTHRDNHSWGGNVFDLYLRKSSGVEPAVGGATGAFEAYFVERTDLSLHNQIAGFLQKSRIVRDVSGSMLESI